MTNATEKELADLREQVAAQKKTIAAQQRELDALRSKAKGTSVAGKAPTEVALIEIYAKDLKSVRAMTEEEAQQKIEKTKSVKIDVAGEITRQDVTPENKKITVTAPTNLREGQLVVIDLFDKDGGKIINLAYDVKTNEQELCLGLRNAASQKRFRQLEDNFYEESVKANR
ncbi:hypothetical protein ABIF90_007789 [Bradyrhizobium japonicum]